MVEKSNATTQLPISTQVDKILMHGTIDQFKAAVFEMLEEVPLNELETQLLNRFLSEPTDCAPKVADLLNKVSKRVAD